MWTDTAPSATPEPAGPAGGSWGGAARAVTPQRIPRLRPESGDPSPWVSPGGLEAVEEASSVISGAAVLAAGAAAYAVRRAVTARRA